MGVRYFCFVLAALFFLCNLSGCGGTEEPKEMKAAGKDTVVTKPAAGGGKGKAAFQ
jgi:hypothetical protein